MQELFCDKLTFLRHIFHLKFGHFFRPVFYSQNRPADSLLTGPKGGKATVHNYLAQFWKPPFFPAAAGKKSTIPVIDPAAN